MHLTSIKESNLSNSEQTPEENMIERYVLQYQTPTKKITHSLPIDGITPFDRIGGLDISNIITHRFDIRDFEKGFEVMNSGKSGKVILDWSDI